VAVSEHNLAHAGDVALARYAEVGELLTGRRDPRAFLDWWGETAAELGVPGLAALGLDADGIDGVAEAAAKASSTKGNPVPVTATELADILRHSL
jgi:alcohol dehydrogenase class IV